MTNYIFCFVAAIIAYDLIAYLCVIAKFRVFKCDCCGLQVYVLRKKHFALDHFCGGEHEGVDEETIIKYK